MTENFKKIFVDTSPIIYLLDKNSPFCSKAEKAFWKFLDGCQIDICNIEITTAIKAAEIRAEYPYFKTPDALQLATASLNGCDLFLTNDKQLKNFKEFSCVTVEEWSIDE